MHKRLIAKQILFPKKKKKLFDSGDFFLELETERRKTKKFFFGRWKYIYINNKYN
jgi:hypothetical protein